MFYLFKIVKGNAQHLFNRILFISKLYTVVLFSHCWSTECKEGNGRKHELPNIKLTVCCLYCKVKPIFNETPHSKSFYGGIYSVMVAA